MSSSVSSTINSVTRRLNYVCAIPMIVLGISGAILTIIVFTRQPSFRRNPTVTSLLAGAVYLFTECSARWFQSAEHLHGFDQSNAGGPLNCSSCESFGYSTIAISFVRSTSLCTRPAK